MGWWRRMRNKFKTRKSTARPTRYLGHGDAFGGAARDRDHAPGPGIPPPSSPPPEKALLESSEERLSLSLLNDRPSLMSDRDGRFEQMSFELPRR